MSDGSFKPGDVSRGPSSQDRRTRAQAIAVEVFARRGRGEVVLDEQVLQEHLDIFPELAGELEGIRQLRTALLAGRRAGPAVAIAPLSGSALEQPIEGSTATEPLEPDEPRPQIGGYHILAELGRGGQATVYRAVQETTGQTVAIKVVTGGPLINSTHRARFEREVRILSTLDHPHIVRIFDRGRTADGSFYLVMEYVDGQSFGEFAVECAAQDPCHPKTIVTALAKVARAVHAAHRSGVIHRDLKPSNIRIDRHGEPRILDFGLASASVDTTTALTTTGEWLGSLPWFSPEQVTVPGHEADAASDVYALGVIAYEAIAGRFPYDTGGALKQVLERIATQHPLPPSKASERRLSRPGDIDAVVYRAVAKDPARRYRSAEDLALDLEAISIGGRPKAASSALWRRPAALALLIVLACTAVGAACYWRPRPNVIQLPHWTNSAGMVFVRLGNGRFAMGSQRPESGRQEDEVLHAVVLTRPFWIGATEVTAGQYALVMGTQRPVGMAAALPVTGVSWQDATEFCKRLSVLEGRTYRLPTEAEWEYACRSTDRGLPALHNLDRYAWFGTNSGSRLHPVAQREPNEWGLYDMLGNAEELCADGYSDFRPGDAVDPKGPLPVRGKVEALARGGSIFCRPMDCRPASRFKVDCQLRRPEVGFRLATDDPPPPLAPATREN